MLAELSDLVSSPALVPHPRVPLDEGRSAPVGDELGEPFVGRDGELARLRAALDEVRGGRPQVVVVEGAAGIGKTALVERFLQGASDVEVLRCGGERDVAAGFDVVDELFRAAGMTSARLLAGHAPGLPYFEPITVGAHILSFLAEHDAKGPVVLVVDDLQWADPESLRALLFALRRLTGERVLTLLMTRDDASGPAEGLCRLAAHRGGALLRLAPLTLAEVRTLACSMTDRAVPTGLATRLHSQTRGNPHFLRAVLAELSGEQWLRWDPALPAPRALVRWVREALRTCSPTIVRLVEAAAVLGDGCRLRAVASLAGDAEDPLATVELAGAVGLLTLREDLTGRQVVFPHPLVRAAVYEQVGPARRVRLHLAAAELVDEEGPRLRHRVAAADPPDEALAAELSDFAERQAAAGAWTDAASAFLEASRMSSSPRMRERRHLRAMDLLTGAGEVDHARALAAERARVEPDGLRDAVLAHLAAVGGLRDLADALLDGAWERCHPSGDPSTAALVAERWAAHSFARLRPRAVVDWARRATALAPADGPAAAMADALLLVGLAWTGQMPAVPQASADGSSPAALGIARGTLLLVVDDVAGARAELSDAVRAEHRVGSVVARVWAFVWLSRAAFVAGSWDESVVAAARAVALLEETGHEWLRPLARWVAVAVPAARGEWAAAEEHARLAGARGGDYELMVVAAGLARAQVAVARGDHEGVLRGLAPVVELAAREGVDEPGFWPWQGMYGDALVSAGHLERAEEFLVPHEALAAARGRRSSVAAMARVRGRLEAAAGRADAAEAAFEQGLAALAGLSVPFERALLELAYGQMLRRGGQRRAAVERLQAAHDRFAGLGARPYVERCERELSASGLAPAGSTAQRHAFDPSRLTAQELAVAQLVARGLSNRQVASELFVSVKTVQFHLTRIYSKLRVSCRAELAASYGSVADAPPRAGRARRRRSGTR